MTAQEARARAEGQKGFHQVPADWKPGPAEPRWIELCDAAAGLPGPVRDLRVWVIRYRTQIQWIDLAIDDGSGQVVRVERSR